MVKVSIVGITGRMGVNLTEILNNNRDFEIIGGISNTKKSAYKLFTSFEEMVVNSDVIIDFSTPSVTMRILPLCVEFFKPIVIGTTGFSTSDMQKISKYAENIPIFISSNFSFGINMLNIILRKYSKFFDMDQYDIEILETHHRNKKDAPSGTALSLAAAIADSYCKKLVDFVHNNNVDEPIKDRSKIGIAFRRGGNVFGDHTVSFLGDFEVIDFSHRALDRKVFAYGAFKAMKWILDKSKGLYTMQDMLSEI